MENNKNQNDNPSSKLAIITELMDKPSISNYMILLNFPKRIIIKF
jgi:hypothetical protein